MTPAEAQAVCNDPASTVPQLRAAWRVIDAHHAAEERAEREALPIRRIEVPHAAGWTAWAAALDELTEVAVEGIASGSDGRVRWCEARVRR